MRIQKYILSLIPIMFFNVIYFLWQPYNKHLLPLFVSESQVADTITNILYHILWLGLIVLISELCFVCEHRSSSNKKIYKKFFSLIALQIASDILKFFLYEFFEGFPYIVLSTLLDSLIFILMLFFVVRRPNMCFYKKYMYFFVAIALFLFYIFCCTQINSEIIYIQEKYIGNSKIYLNSIDNMNFLYEFSSCIFETLLFGVIYTAFYFSLNRNKEKELASIREYVVFGLRIFLIFLGLFFVNIKVLILPQSFLGGIEFSSTSIYNNDFFDNKIDFEDNDICLYRNNNSSRKYVFQGTYITMKHLNNKLNSYFQLYNYDKNSNSLSYKCTQETFNDSDIKFQIYGDELITYIENDYPYYFFTKDIEMTNQNNTLILCIKSLIRKGDWNYFEHCASYLMKYDPNFIEFYIAKYANGDFSESEKHLLCNADIKTEYIQKIAKSLIE